MAKPFVPKRPARLRLQVPTLGSRQCPCVMSFASTIFHSPDAVQVRVSITARVIVDDNYKKTIISIAFPVPRPASTYC